MSEPELELAKGRSPDKGVGKVVIGDRTGKRSDTEPKLSPSLGWSRLKYPRLEPRISIQNMLRNGFLGLFLNLKTLNYSFIAAYNKVRQEIFFITKLSRFLKIG